MKVMRARGQVELKYAESRTEAKALELSTEAHLAQLARREQARPLLKGFGASARVPQRSPCRGAPGAPRPARAGTAAVERG